MHYNTHTHTHTRCLVFTCDANGTQLGERLRVATSGAQRTCATSLFTIQRMHAAESSAGYSWRRTSRQSQATDQSQVFFRSRQNACTYSSSHREIKRDLQLYGTKLLIMTLATFSLAAHHCTLDRRKAQIPLGSSRHVVSQRVWRVERMHFDCVELVEQHGSTRSTRQARLARYVERVVSRPDVTSQMEFGLKSSAMRKTHVHCTGRPT